MCLFDRRRERLLYHLKAIVIPPEVSVTSLVFFFMYLYISQELTPQPPDLLSSGGKEKYKRTKDRKTRLSLFSWLSFKMSACYSPLQGEMMQHGRLAPQNRIWIKCLHLALTVSLMVFMVIRSTIPFIIIIQTEIKGNHVAARRELSRLAVRADE